MSIFKRTPVIPPEVKEWTDFLKSLEDVKNGEDWKKIRKLIVLRIGETLKVLTSSPSEKDVFVASIRLRTLEELIAFVDGASRQAEQILDEYLRQEQTEEEARQRAYQGSFSRGGDIGS